MDTYLFIAQQLSTSFPGSSSDTISEVTNLIYNQILTTQGKQEVDHFERVLPRDIALSIENRLMNGWQVFQMNLSGENGIDNPSNPGNLITYPGMSGVIIYTKP